MPQQTCNACKGTKLLEMRLLYRGNYQPNWTIVGCHICNGKGHITQEDHDRIHNILNPTRTYRG